MKRNLPKGRHVILTIDGTQVEASVLYRSAGGEFIMLLFDDLLRLTAEVSVCALSVLRSEDGRWTVLPVTRSSDGEVIYGERNVDVEVLPDVSSSA